MEYSKKIKNIKNEDETHILAFSTSKGLNVIQSPTKSFILSLILNEEISFDEIVKITEKSKSTISVHLRDLVDEGIIDSRIDSEDKRKKIFYLNSRYVGRFIPQKWGQREENSVEFLTDHMMNQGNPHEFFQMMFHIFRVELIQEGINIDPLLNRTGIKIGETIYHQLKDDQTDKLIHNLSNFWKNNGLGQIELENMDPLTIRAYDCFECELLPKIGESACALDSGILEAVFSIHLAKKVNVTETKCYSRGDEYCCFEII